MDPENEPEQLGGSLNPSTSMVFQWSFTCGPPWQNVALVPVDCFVTRVTRDRRAAQRSRVPDVRFGVRDVFASPTVSKSLYKWRHRHLSLGERITSLATLCGSRRSCQGKSRNLVQLFLRRGGLFRALPWRNSSRIGLKLLEALRFQDLYDLLRRCSTAAAAAGSVTVEKCGRGNSEALPRCKGRRKGEQGARIRWFQIMPDPYFCDADVFGWVFAA